MNRRQFLSVLAACPVASVAFQPAAAGVETTTPPSPRGEGVAVPVPRGVVVEMPPAHSHTLTTSEMPTHTHLSEISPGLWGTPATMNVQMIADGRGRWIALESEEGQAIARESAVNLRADGSLRHRQHHPTDFPGARR